MEYLDFAIKIAEQAGKVILKERAKGLQIAEKQKNDLVTNADKAAEASIIEAITKKFPDHGILAEESAEAHSEILKMLAEKDYIWIIDPLDGTTNFAHDLPIFAVSIGLFCAKSSKSSKNYDYLTGELIAGVVYAPLLNELFYAEKGKGAYLNGKRLKTSAITETANALTVTGFPPQHKEDNLANFKKLLDRSQAVRRLGAASLDLCYVAAGRFDAYWELGLKAWDIAAGSLIIEEAGGTVTDTHGEQLDLFGQNILATNKHLHKEMIELLSD